MKKILVLEFNPLMVILLILSLAIPVGMTVSSATPAMANVTTANVTVGSTSAGATSDYTVAFTTGISLTTANTITLNFPSLTVIPSLVEFTINAVPNTGPATVTGTLVTLPLASNVTAGAVSIAFNGAHKITNPTTAGSKTLTVQTSLEATPVASSAYTITAGALSTLTIVQQPTDTYTGWTISPAVTVLAQDGNSPPNPISGLSVNLGWGGTGTITGTTVQTTNGSGIATFNDLSFDTEGGKELIFNSGFVNSGWSNWFTISSAVAITSPTTASPGYGRTGGTATVTFNVQTGSATLGDISIQVLQAGTTTVMAQRDVQYTFSMGANTGLNWPVTLTGVAAGTYDVRVAVRQPAGSGTWVYSTVQSNALIVDNTAPTVILNHPNGGESAAWSGTYTVSWTVTDAIPNNPNVTVSAVVSTDGGASYPYTAFTGLTKLKADTQSWTPAASGISPGDYANARLKLTVTDAAGNSTVQSSAADFFILFTQPQINVSIPNMGTTTWAGGSSYNITFTTTSALNQNVDYKLELWKCSGWSNITPNSDGWLLNRPAGLTTYSWTVPVDYRGYLQIQASVRDKGGNVISTITAPFMDNDVQKPKVLVTAPGTGSSVYSGIDANICWTAYDNVTSICGGDQLLTYTWYLSTDGGSTWGPALGSGTGAQAPTTPICNTLWSTWRPSVTATQTNCMIKVTATDFATVPNTGTGYSNIFTIINGTGVNPTVILSSPNSGPLTGGTCQTISWSATDPANSASLLSYFLAYSTDGGTTYPNAIATLTNQDQGPNSFSWAVPVTAGALYRVQVTALSPSGGSGFAFSSSNITVAAADAAVTTSSPITLYPGWNLISLQLMPTCVPSTTTPVTGFPIKSVLAQALARINSVWYWTGGTSGAWQSWAPESPSNSLQSMTDGKAYWVYVSPGSSITFTYQGRKGPAGGGFPTTPYSYVTGWNMVGFKSTIAKVVSAYLGGTCGTTYGAPIYSWDPVGQTWASPSPACSDNLSSGSGYWVNFNVPWTVNAGAD